MRTYRPRPWSIPSPGASMTRCFLSLAQPAW